MRAHASSNFTYADDQGNIALYYNARLPHLPHESTGDTAAIALSRSDMWTEIVPWESLPLYVNPPGGYVQQANDTPDFINLNVTLDRDTVAQNLPKERLRFRSQLSFDLIHGDFQLSLEDVVELKHLRACWLLKECSTTCWRRRCIGAITCSSKRPEDPGSGTGRPPQPAAARPLQGLV